MIKKKLSILLSRIKGKTLQFWAHQIFALLSVLLIVWYSKLAAKANASMF